MQLSNLPARIRAAFAVSGAKNTIPVASQIGITPGAASFTDGFPPLTMQALNAGGVPPSGQDFNGIFNAVTLIQQWQSAGGAFPYDATWSTANNGYPKGAVLLRADGTGFWFNTTDNNTADPDGATPTGWVPEWQYGITAVTGLTNANVTLTSLQYGRPVITLAGTLTGNVQIIFPATQGEQWLVQNNTTGAFTVTLKTAAGTGVVAAQGSATGVWSDGTNINSTASAGRLLGIQNITVTGTYTKTPGTLWADVQLVGGGGGGGGTNATGAGQGSAGTGGAGGGYSRRYCDLRGVNTVSCSIGTAGTSAANSSGTTGGTTSFGAFCSATGGTGGGLAPAQSSAATIVNGGAAGGSGSSGDLNAQGGYGMYAVIGPLTLGGGGGASAFGSGAPPSTGVGNSASSFGAGGSGGAVGASGAAVSGGSGVQGRIIVMEYGA